MAGVLTTEPFPQTLDKRTHVLHVSRERLQIIMLARVITDVYCTRRKGASALELIMVRLKLSSVTFSLNKNAGLRSVLWVHLEIHTVILLAISNVIFCLESCTQNNLLKGWSWCLSL